MEPGIRRTMTTSAIDYSVLIPFYNEAGNVEALIGEVAAALDGEQWELVAVDDASTDNTGDELNAAANVHPQLRVVRHRGNYGQSAAICSAADAARGEWLITLDGDGQNDPADIPGLLSVAREHGANTMVCGHRVSRQDSGLRRLSSIVANGVRARLLGDATPDTGCALKIIRRSTFMALPRFNHMHRFLPALVIRNHGEVISVAVKHRPRRHGTSKYGVWNRLWVGIVDLAGVIWLQRRGLSNDKYLEPKE